MNFFNTYVLSRAQDIAGEVLTSALLNKDKLAAKFEAEIQSSLGMKNLVALNSITSELPLALVLEGILESDEAILPARTFIASGMEIKYVGADPVFPDIQYQLCGIDPNSTQEEITTKTKEGGVSRWAMYT